MNLDERRVPAATGNRACRRNNEAAGISGGFPSIGRMSVYRDSSTSSAMLLISNTSAFSIETTLSWKLVMQ